MDHAHKSTAGKSRLTKAQAEFRGALVKDSLVKRREREMREAIDRAVARFCRTAEDEAQLRATFDLVHAMGVTHGIDRWGESLERLTAKAAV